MQKVCVGGVEIISIAVMRQFVYHIVHQLIIPITVLTVLGNRYPSTPNKCVVYLNNCCVLRLN